MLTTTTTTIPTIITTSAAIDDDDDDVVDELSFANWFSPGAGSASADQAGRVGRRLQANERLAQLLHDLTVQLQALCSALQTIRPQDPNSRSLTRALRAPSQPPGKQHLSKRPKRQYPERVLRLQVHVKGSE